MDISDILPPEGVIANLRASSKRHALEELAKAAGPIVNLHERTIFDTLLERERLGTTGVGHGIAIPHGKIQGLTRLHALFGRLERPIPFDAIDEQPVDLMFLLLAPQDAGADHLKALARASRLLRDTSFCDQLRACKDSKALYDLLRAGPTSRAA